MSTPPRATVAPVVLLFPGQSSVDREMVLRARRLGEAANAVLDRAALVLGDRALSRYVGESGACLTTNRDIQVAGFLTTQMHLAALEEAGIRATLSLGLSLGEYSHLVHVGALRFDAALELVNRRGAAYDTSPPGIMVAVLGAVREEVASAVDRAREVGTVVISNFNTPTQHVLAGERLAVERAAQLLADECGATCIETEGRVPMHSPMLASVAETFRPALTAAPWATPRLLYLPNVTARFELRPDATTFASRLLAHVTEPVQWRASVESVAAIAPDAWFIEVGPGSVVHNMLTRSWISVRRGRTDAPDADGIVPAFSALLQRLRDDN